MADALHIQNAAPVDPVLQRGWLSDTGQVYPLNRCTKKEEAEMIHRQRYHRLLAGAVSVLAVLILFGCAARKPLWGDPESGLILSYRATEGKALKYRNTSSTVQELDMMGQPMKTTIETVMGFTAIPKVQEEENLLLAITVDKLDINAAGPMGSMPLATGQLLGKGFDMTLSPMGKELNLSGAAALTYQVNPGATTSLKSMFDGSFPDLPGRPVKIGDTWPGTDDVTTNDNNTRMHFVLEHVNVLEGIETVDGLECVRIASKMSGTIEGDGADPGLGDFTFDGKGKGTSTWYFAYKEGVLAKSKTELTFVIDVASAMGPIPVTMVVTNEMKLVR